MFSKLAAVALLQIFLASSFADETWDGFVAKWAGDKATGFHTLPQTVGEAQNQGWTTISNYTSQYSDDVVAMGLKGDPRFSVLFSKKTEKYIGVLISIPAVDVDGKQPMNFSTTPSFITKVLNSETYHTAAVFFIVDELTGAHRIFFEEKSEIIEVPTNATEVVAKTDFLEKRCVPGMGMHYNKLNSNSDCATMYPWFLTGQDDNIHGVGFAIWGKISSASERTWWEKIEGWVEWYLVPDSPSCIETDLALYGITVEHVWVIADPSAVSCGNVTWPNI